MTYQISGKIHRELPVPAPSNLCLGAAEDVHKQDHHCFFIPSLTKPKLSGHFLDGQDMPGWTTEPLPRELSKELTGRGAHPASGRELL